MFTVTYMHNPSGKVSGRMDLRFSTLEAFDAVSPSIGTYMIMSFSNGGQSHDKGYMYTKLPLFQYDPFRSCVVVYEYNKNNQLTTAHVYTKSLGCSEGTQITSTYLWKKLFIPFSFEDGIFVLDRKKLIRKKRKVYTTEAINLCAKDKKACGFVLTKVCSSKCNGFKSTIL